MTPEPFDGWTPEGLGIALRMSQGDLSRAPRRHPWMVFGIGGAALLIGLALGALAWLAWHTQRERVRA